MEVLLSREQEGHHFRAGWLWWTLFHQSEAFYTPGSTHCPESLLEPSPSSIHLPDVFDDTPEYPSHSQLPVHGGDGPSASEQPPACSLTPPSPNLLGVLDRTWRSASSLDTLQDTKPGSFTVQRARRWSFQKELTVMNALPFIFQTCLMTLQSILLPHSCLFMGEMVLLLLNSLLWGSFKVKKFWPITQPINWYHYIFLSYIQSWAYKLSDSGKKVKEII